MPASCDDRVPAAGRDACIRGLKMAAHKEESAMNSEKKEQTDTSPHEYDDSTANRVEKKPAGKQSPQQEHDDEDQG